MPHAWWLCDWHSSIKHCEMRSSHFPSVGFVTAERQAKLRGKKKKITRGQTLWKSLAWVDTRPQEPLASSSFSLSPRQLNSTAGCFPVGTWTQKPQKTLAQGQGKNFPGMLEAELRCPPGLQAVTVTSSQAFSVSHIGFRKLLWFARCEVMKELTQPGPQCLPKLSKISRP